MTTFSALLLTNRSLILAYFLLGLLLNNVLHIYRFYKLDWLTITGLFGQRQPISVSLYVSLWALFAHLFIPTLTRVFRKYPSLAVLFAFLSLVLNQAAGRSVLKLTLDVLLVMVLLS